MLNKPLVRWSLINVSLVMLPLLIVITGLYYVTSLQRINRLRTFETDAAEVLESMRYYAATEKYICTSLAAVFDANQDPAGLKAAVEKYAADHELEFRYFINNPDGSIHYSNFPLDKARNDYPAAFAVLNSVRTRAFRSERDIPEDAYDNTRRIYGPHFFPRYYHRCFIGKDIRLRRGHAASGKPLLWLNISEKTGLSVFLPAEVLYSYCGVRKFVKQTEGKLIKGFISSGEVRCHDAALSQQINEKAVNLQKSLITVVRLPDYYLFTNFIDSTMTVFCAVEAGEIEKLEFSPVIMGITALMFFGLVVFAVLSYQVIVRGRILAMKLKRQLLILFIASNALPGFVLYAIGSDYLQQYRSGLLADVYNDGMAYLQSIDELYKNEFTVQKSRIENYLVAFQKSLRKKGVTKRAVQSFLKKQNPRAYGFYLVASSTGMVAGDRGILKNEKVHDAFNSRFATDKVRINTMRAMFKVGTYVLASLNRQPISSKAGAEAELVSETLTQRDPSDLIRMFADSGTFSEWGIGSKKHPTYVGLLQLFDKVIYDYMLLYLWDSDDLESAFITRIFHNLNRNEIGLRVMATDDRFEYGLPEIILTDPTLKSFALKLRDRGVARPEYCRLDNADHLLFGHKCVSMKNIRLLGLFPMSRIENQVSEKRKILGLLAFVSLLVSVSLGLFVAGGILKPLSELQAGILALRERNFAWRVPDLGGDEFGHLASIFNETLIDLEELHVASQVKEKLLTTLADTEIFGQAAYYCHAGSREGEYFDVNDVDETSRALLFGHVNEPGVAGSLILAFVKSATLQLQGLLATPQKFISGLNRLLFENGRPGELKTMQAASVLLSDNGRIVVTGTGLPKTAVFNTTSGNLEILTEPVFSDDDAVSLGAVQSPLARGFERIPAAGEIILMTFSTAEFDPVRTRQILCGIGAVRPDEFCRLAAQKIAADLQGCAVLSLTRLPPASAG